MTVAQEWKLELIPRTGGREGIEESLRTIDEIFGQYICVNIHEDRPR